MESELSLALEFHRHGRYADAARLYHGLLAREPNHADALHLFGVMHHECGHSRRAVELIGRAVAVRPGAAVFYSNMAEAHRALGQHELAIDCCQNALRLQPDCPEALNNLGLALQSLGRLELAADRFCSALRNRPEFAMARNNLGTVLRQQDKIDEALEAFRAAVSLDPECAEARANLGQSLVDRGDAEEGLTQCLEAVRIRPDFAAGYNNLGNAHRALNQWAEAHASYAKSVRLAPDLPEVHVNRGIAFRGDGRFAQAAASFRRAVELAPDDISLWQSLANAHTADEDHGAAIPCYERLLEFQPDRAAWHNELGWVLAQEGRHAEAETCYARALEIYPGMLDAQLNRGSLREILGNLDLAEACYRGARADHPEAPQAMAHLATLLRGRLPESDVQAITTLLDAPGVGGGARKNLLFGLAQVADARQEYARAAAYLEQANALALEENRRRNRRYDPLEHSRFVDRLIDEFTPELFERLTGAGDPTRQPIFVFGMPRSGTTLVEQILASHSRVHGAGELRLARQTFGLLPNIVGRDDAWPQCLAALDTAGVAELARRHREALAAIVNRDRPAFTPHRIVDKMPDNYLYAGLLSIIFPHATLIHVRRDPRDIALSCWMTQFRSIRWANDIEHLTGRLEGHRRITDHWRIVLSTRVHEVAYERLVTNFNNEARRLIELCGLDWEPACLQFHHTLRPVRTASVTQVRQPLYDRSVARWKHYEDSMKALFENLPAIR
jgi:tetratricopeptide (TPR) repeat protein